MTAADLKENLKLKQAIQLACHAAWQHIKQRYPKEVLYAFGVYTTPDAEYFVPFACGELGLHQVAARYMKERRIKDIESAKKELRWSVADSPYHEELGLLPDTIDECLKSRPSPFDDSSARAVREVRNRFEAVTVALNELDKTGLFGKGAPRSRIVLLIEAGDRDADWVQGFAKKLNPRPVFEAYRKLFELPAEGKYAEWGTKKVYSTDSLALSHDRKLLAVAAEYRVFLFDTRHRKQLWERAISSVRGEYMSANDVAISADGSCIAAVGKSLSSKKSLLTIWRDKSKERIHVDLPSQPLSIAMAPDSSWFAVGAMDNQIHVFDSKGKRARTLKGHRGWPRNLSVTLDGSRLASADSSSGVRVWDAFTWTVAWQSPLHSDCVHFDATGTHLVTALRSPYPENDPGRQLIRLWDARKGRVLREFEVPGFIFNAASISPDGRTIACAAEAVKDAKNDVCILIDTATGKVLERLRLGVYIDWFNDLLFLSRREWLVSAQGHTLKPVLCWQLQRPR